VISAAAAASTNAAAPMPPVRTTILFIFVLSDHALQ
jgi:hypothetical protein